MVNANSSASRVRLNIIDILRILGGILFLNAFLSWWFTSSTTWGYNGKWVDTRYLKFRLLSEQRNFTMAELALYNGSDPSLPIYIGLYGNVYDVTSGKDVYGPSGSYRFFSGKDSARAFSTGCFNKKDELTYDLRGLDFDEAMEDITSWQNYYENHSKYWFAGYVEHPPLVGEPPSACQQMKYPGHKKSRQ